MKLISGSYPEANKDGTLAMVILPGPHLISSWYCTGLGCLAMVFAILLRDTLSTSLGVLFILAGVFFLRKANTRTTAIFPNGTITVTTAWIFGGKKSRNIQILHRRGVKYIQPLYLYSFTFDTPLAEEATRISAQLKVPLNTIMFKKPTDIKTYIPQTIQIDSCI